MTVRRVKITGARGDWTAEVEGRRLPVIHNSWRQGPTGYLDPMVGVKLDGKRYQTFLAALRASDLVVMQRDTPGELSRAGYVGVFHFKDLLIGEKGSIALQLTERYADPR